MQWNPKMDKSHQIVKTQGLFIDCIDRATIHHPPLSLFISCLASGITVFLIFLYCLSHVPSVISYEEGKDTLNFTNPST